MPPRAAAAKKPAAPRAARAKVVPATVEPEVDEVDGLPPELDDDTAPEVVVIESGVVQPDAERVPVFTLRGVTYSMPAEIPPKKALKILYSFRKEGGVVASLDAVATLCGAEAVRVLLDDDDVTDEHLGRIITVVTNRVFGELKAAGKA